MTVGSFAPKNPSDCSVYVKRFGRKVLLRPGTHDVFVLKEIVEWGEYDIVEGWDLPEDAHILDLGGNIGLASLYFSSLLPRSTFVIVEPAPENLRVLESNCRPLVDVGRMSILQSFVAGEDGESGIDRSLGTLGTRMMTGPRSDGDADTIPCVSVPSLLRRFPTPRIDLMKCDVEGAEAEIFRDCREWIGLVENLIVETHLPRCSPEQLYDSLRANGWDFDVAREDREGSRCTSALRRRPVG